MDISLLVFLFHCFSEDAFGSLNNSLGPDTKNVTELCKKLFRFLTYVLFSCEGEVYKRITEKQTSGTPDLSTGQVHEAFIDLLQCS